MLITNKFVFECHILAVQLVRGGNLDYLMLDYLSEITMSLLVAAQRKNPDLGWCPDFAQSMALLLPQVKKQGNKIRYEVYLKFSKWDHFSLISDFILLYVSISRFKSHYECWRSKSCIMYESNSTACREIQCQF